MQILTLAALAAVAAALVAQSPAPARTLRLPDTSYEYANATLPAHFQSARGLDNTPEDNPITDAGATLGRVLFYDTTLSANSTTSCSSCHRQQHAFSDPNRVSRGFDGRHTDRHAMNLTGLRYYPPGRFFWDERGGNLEDAVLLPIRNPIEMGEDPARLPRKLAAATYLVPGSRRPVAPYPELFRRAFGDPRITEARIARALAQFLRSLVSYRSRFDEGLARATSDADGFESFTRQENRGKALFLRNCASCHLESQDSLFALLVPANNGTELHPLSSDGGLGDVTLNALDAGRFKSPTLRNVEVAGPYLHNGSLATQRPTSPVRRLTPTRPRRTIARCEQARAMSPRHGRAGVRVRRHGRGAVTTRGRGRARNTSCRPAARPACFGLRPSRSTSARTTTSSRRGTERRSPRRPCSRRATRRGPWATASSA